MLRSPTVHPLDPFRLGWLPNRMGWIARTLPLSIIQGTKKLAVLPRQLASSQRAGQAATSLGIAPTTRMSGGLGGGRDPIQRAAWGLCSPITGPGREPARHQVRRTVRSSLMRVMVNSRTADICTNVRNMAGLWATTPTADGRALTNAPRPREKSLSRAPLLSSSSWH